MNVIMILTNGFDPDVRVYKEAKYLVSQGHSVEILCWDRKCEYTEKTEEIIDDIKIKRFHILSQPGTGMKQLGAYLKFIFSVRKYLKKENYTHLHCHDFDGILTGILSKKSRKDKLIFDMHEIYNHYAYAKNIFFKKFFRYILKKVNHIIYVNDEQIKEDNELIKNKCIYLPNYPESDIYVPIEKARGNKDTYKINYIGSVRDFNSLDSLVRLSSEINNIEIGIYGTGIAYDKLVEKYNNNPSVLLSGKYNGITDSGKIYRNTDILYCSYNPNVENWKKAYPVKLFEAIITKTPIIVSNDTVAGEFVVKNGIGEIVEYANQDSIKESIHKIIKNYDKYVFKLNEISDLYNWNSIVKNLDVIYKGN